jgi:hypothetical protein
MKVWNRKWFLSKGDLPEKRFRKSVRQFRCEVGETANFVGYDIDKDAVFHLILCPGSAAGGEDESNACSIVAFEQLATKHGLSAYRLGEP